MRYSYQRQRILEAVQSSTDHPTAVMVYDALKASLPKLSLGTVYRNLNQLADLGRIRKIPLPDGSCRFDGTLHPHSHIVCDICGAVTDVVLPNLPELADSVAAQTGYRLDSYQVIMHGLCQACS